MERRNEKRINGASLKSEGAVWNTKRIPQPAVPSPEAIARQEKFEKRMQAQQVFTGVKVK